MAVEIDIFNPQVSAVADGLSGKIIMLYGSNNTGKTTAASMFSKPYFIECESGLQCISGAKFNRINTWAEFRKIVKQFTSKATVDKARELYDTIVLDNYYSLSLMCQDFVINTYGNGALTLGDGTGKINLYQAYEKEFFKAINTLISCDYTIVYIGHDVDKDGFIRPEGDKRAVNPLVNSCDVVAYIRSNGVDENGKVIKSSAYLAETREFFARSRFPHCVTYIEEFSAANLEKAIKDAIKAEADNGGTVISYEEQKAQNTTKRISFEELRDMVQELGQRYASSGNMEVLLGIVESTLGPQKKVSELTEKQLDAMQLIYDDLTEKANELGI